MDLYRFYDRDEDADLVGKRDRKVRREMTNEMAIEKIGSYPSIFNIGHDAKRNLSTVGQPNSHVFYIANASALGLRIANHNTDIVSASLYTLNFFTVKALSDLSGKVRQG